MKDETIQIIINWINEQSHDDAVFYQMRTDTVARGKAWPHEFNAKISNAEGYDFFFIFSEGTCIGAVLDMGENDLHGYMTPAYRRAGIMSRVLRETILPLLVAEGRTKQVVTFEADGVRLFLERAGFMIEAEPALRSPGRASINLTAVRPSTSAGVARPLTAERLEGVKQRIRLAEQHLKIIADELEISFGAQLRVVEDLRKLASNVSWKQAVIEDANCRVANEEDPTHTA